MFKHFLCFSLLLCCVVSCTQHQAFDDKIISSAFIGTPEKSVLSCLGEPASTKDVHKKHYLTYVGDNHCRVIFIIDKEHVIQVIYTGADGRHIEPEACQLHYRQCTDDGHA